MDVVRDHLKSGSETTNRPLISKNTIQRQHFQAKFGSLKRKGLALTYPGPLKTEPSPTNVGPGDVTYA